MFTTLSKHTPVVQGDDLGVQTYISLCQRRHMKKKVAVIGAGPSGLVVAKECQELGHSVTIFEASDRIGGVFGHCYEDVSTVYFLPCACSFPLSPPLAPTSPCVI